MKCLNCGKEIKGTSYGVSPEATGKKFCCIICKRKWHSWHRINAPIPRVTVGLERHTRTPITNSTLDNLKLETRILSEMGLFTNEAL